EPLPLLDTSIESVHNISKASLSSYKQEQEPIYEGVLKNDEMDKLHKHQKLQEQFIRQELLKKQAKDSQKNLLTVCQKLAEQKKWLQERQDKVICQEFLHHQNIEQELSQNFSGLNVVESKENDIKGMQAESFIEREQISSRCQSPNLMTRESRNTHYSQEHLGGNTNLHQIQDSKNDTDLKSVMEKNLILRKRLEETVKAIYGRKERVRNMNSSTGNISDVNVGATKNEIKYEQVAHAKMQNKNDPPFTLEQLMLIKEAQSQQNKLPTNGFHVGAIKSEPLSPSYEASVNGSTHFGKLNDNDKILYCIEALEKKRKKIVNQLVASPDSDDLILAIKEMNSKINDLKAFLGK
ncbi:unnamed protein product, partial [Meganyctiphanes norvegica]